MRYLAIKLWIFPPCARFRHALNGNPYCYQVATCTWSDNVIWGSASFVLLTLYIYILGRTARIALTVRLYVAGNMPHAFAICRISLLSWVMIQCGAVITLSIFYKRKQTHKRHPHSSPVRARYGVSVVSLNSDYKFCSCHPSAINNIVINYTAL